MSFEPSDDLPRRLLSLWASVIWSHSLGCFLSGGSGVIYSWVVRLLGERCGMWWFSLEASVLVLVQELLTATGEQCGKGEGRGGGVWPVRRSCRCRRCR